jgi:hypothetical protein
MLVSRNASMSWLIDLRDPIDSIDELAHRCARSIGSTDELAHRDRRSIQPLDDRAHLDATWAVPGTGFRP